MMILFFFRPRWRAAAGPVRQRDRALGAGVDGELGGRLLAGGHVSCRSSFGAEAVLVRGEETRTQDIAPALAAAESGIDRNVHVTLSRAWRRSSPPCGLVLVRSW